MEMSPIRSVSSSEPSKTSAPVVARPRSNPGRTSRPKTSYGFAHPATHACHKRLRLRPKLLLQLQQVSQTPRPLPVVDVLPSTSYLPLLARKFPAMFRSRNGLGPYDLTVVISEFYGRTVTSIPEKHVSSEDKDEDHREVVATICQKLQEDAWLKGKAEICLNSGPVWEASPLLGGSYEFIARTENGMQVVRWTLSGGRHRRMTALTDGKRFTFSIIDPTTRRHPVIASMTRIQLEIHDEYFMAAQSSAGPTTPPPGMLVASDMSDRETPLNANLVKLDDGLRTLIIITGIWVAFREGWSDNFSYGDPVSTASARSIVSQTSSRYGSPTTAMNENEPSTDGDEASPIKEPVNGGKRRMSVPSARRSDTTPTDDGKQFGRLSKRPNSTGAAFTDRDKRHSASGLSTRLNRHNMFTSSSENGRDIGVSRLSSLPQNSLKPGEFPWSQRPRAKSTTKVKPATENTKTVPASGRYLPASNPRHTQPNDTRKEKLESPRSEASNSDSTTGKAADAMLREKFASRLVLVTENSEPEPKQKLSSKIGRNLMQMFGGK